SSLLLDASLGLARIFLGAQRDDADVRSLAREQHRHRPADAGVAAGDEGRHVLQLGASEVTRRHEAWREAEVGLPAGLVEPLGGHVGGLRAIAGLHRRRAGARRALPRFKLALAILEATSALDRARGRIARPGTGWLGCVHAAYSCNGIANALRAA